MNVSHHDPIYNVKWIHSKAGSEYMSCSTDGHIMCWEKQDSVDKTSKKLIRKVDYTITEYNLASKKDKVADLGDAAHKIFGASVLEVNPELTNKYLIGTERGMVIPLQKRMKDFKKGQE